MFVCVTRESRNGQTETGGIVLNTSCISKVQTYASTKARFRFTPHPEDRQGGFDTYIVSESKSVVQADMNRSFSAVTMSLGIYPNNDVTETPVATVFNCEDIVKAYPHTPGDHTKCWVEINERGFKARKYLTTSYYYDIYDYGRYGTTSSTSTSTSSTSSTSTSSTSTSSTTSTTT